jgi:hypothetical protein
MSRTGSHSTRLPAGSQGECSDDSGGIREGHNIEHSELIESTRVKTGGSSQLQDRNDNTCTLMGCGFDSSIHD